MRKIILTLPSYRLLLQFKFVKRRRASIDEPLIPDTKTLNIRYRVGNTFNKLSRYFFENRKVKSLLGSNMAVFLVAGSLIPSSVLGGNINTYNTAESELTTIDSTVTPIKTEVGTQFPVENISITQTYRFYHPALDLDGITGDPIKPIKKGVVESVSYSRFSYGNSVIIDHGNNLKSLYAHLSKIHVNQGQTVGTESIIGEMGSTGRSFGDHLHLEVYENGRNINPLTLLPR